MVRQVGVLGLRQCGKSTLLSSLLGVPNQVTLDDQDAVEDARISAKNFLAKLPTPLAIDEAQKVPALFDAIKLAVDRRRAPGKYFLTGSSQFSARLGIRESLTGRIGLHYLYPLTLAEAHQVDFSPERATPLHRAQLGEGRSLSLGRIFVLKEIRAAAEYSGKRIRPVFYKSARSSPVDFIWADVPIKVSVSPRSQVAYDERVLSVAMRKLEAKSAILAWAHDGVELESRGISHVPWTYWS